MSELQYCKVRGRLRSVGERVDQDGMPLFTPMEGEGYIACSVATLARVTEPETFFPTRIPFVIDEDGYISKDGFPFIMVLAPSPALNPPDFNYRIRLQFANGKLYGPFPFEATPGGVVDVTDLIQAGMRHA